MADISKSMSVYQGFNFKKDTQEPIGHVTTLKIGAGEALKVDLSVVNPENVAETVKVVGVASGVNWGGGYADPIEVQCNVSITNKKALDILVQMELSNTNVEFDFVCYQYDREAKGFFKSLHTGDATIKGILTKSGGDLMLYIDDDQNDEVQKPENYSVSFSVVPEDELQAIQVAVSTMDKFTKPWGVAREA